MMNLKTEEIKVIAELPYSWEKIKDKTILVSGGTGFIGTAFVDVIKYRNQKYNENIKVISFSRRGGESSEYLECIKANVKQPLHYEGKIDYIIHLASNTHPKQYAEDPIGTIMTNIYGCDNLLKLAVEKKARFLLASSVEIYGQGTAIPMNEEYCGYIDCNLARSGYNEAKRTCEALTQSYRSVFGVNAVIARFARVFGADKKHDTKAMSQFMDKAVLGEDIILKSKGQQRYSYCYIADAVSGLLKLLLDGQDGEAYNISNDDDGLTLGEYAEYIASLHWQIKLYTQVLLMHTLIISLEHWNIVLFALKQKHLINRISREMQQSIIQIEKHHGQESLNINGLNLVKMKMVTNFRKQSSVVNLVPSGNREMNHIIR